VSELHKPKWKSAKRKPTQQDVKYFKDGAVCGKEADPDKIIVSEFDEDGLIARKAFLPRERAKWLGRKRVRPTMWCIDPECRYPLDGLMANRCPECGREFDPDNPQTYLASRRQTQPSSKWGVLLLVGPIILALMFIHRSGGGAPRFYSGLLAGCIVIGLVALVLWYWAMGLKDPAQYVPLKWVALFLIFVLILGITIRICIGLLFAALYYVLTGDASLGSGTPDFQ
jgi:hypothetical protein